MRLSIELYYQEVWLVLDNIYMRICLAHNHVTDQGLPIQHLVVLTAVDTLSYIPIIPCMLRVLSPPAFSEGAALWVLRVVRCTFTERDSSRRTWLVFVRFEVRDSSREGG